MTFEIVSAPVRDLDPAPEALVDAELLAAGVAAAPGGPVLDGVALAAAARYGIDLTAVLDAEKVSGRAGEVVRVPVPAGSGGAGWPARFLLVGTGGGQPVDLRRAGAALGRSVRGRRVVVTSLADRPGPGAELAVRALVEGLLLGGHTPPATGLTDRAQAAPARVVRLVRAGRRAVPGAAVALGERFARATTLARDLTATPSDVKSPAWLADQAVRVAAEGGLQVDVWDERRLAREGFGGLLAVGAGSASPPRLVRLDYRPEGSGTGGGARGGTGGGTGGGGRAGRLVLVGKGITYDTGGLSIKPREAMVAMKTDMAGAAAVLAAIGACRELGVRRPVTALLPLAENAFGGSAYRPGDVVRQYGGRTVEVANTDAEGRLVLADALAYADARLDPAVLVDLATLTGAASLGLGRRHAALYATDGALATALEAASAASGERVWRMPLVEEYGPALDSEVADLRQVSADSRIGAGSITAALFLRAFTGRRAWAHLDIAGPARADKDEHETGRGATGFGSRLLLHWLTGLR